MNKRNLFVVCGIMAVSALWGASVPYTLQCRTKVIRGDSVSYENRTYTYAFNVEVISDTAGRKPESAKWGKPFIAAVPEERYSIRLHNPLPVRAAVNLTIDGLSSITGAPAAPASGKKWIIEPNSYVTIRGWQVTGSEARRFFFTSKEDSYAAWRSNSWGKDLSVNCGVIGAAYFWSKNDMETWFERNPVVEEVMIAQSRDSKKSTAAASAVRSESKSVAGTGMGEKESHSVSVVAFKYDTGMYRTQQAVVIYYDFPPSPPRPAPFDEGYAPEMPAPAKR
ncbi:MAG: hypothetical protein HZC28_18105 [Spirochaetes bacterium]|nr:hypothetical protein [Spirochaetota bacterium]